MTSGIPPVRPQLNVSSDPPPGARQRVGEGGRDDQDYEPTDPADGAPPVTDLEDMLNTEDMPEDTEAKDAGDRAGGPDQSVHTDGGNERVPKSLRSPIQPSAEDVANHNLTHATYRNWCPACVKAKGREDAHRRAAGHEEDKSGLPIVSLDYATINDDTDKEIKLIVGKCEATGGLLAHKVLCKGVADEWATKKIIRDLEELGKSGIILKTDGEPAIVALQNRIQSMRMARTVPRTPRRTIPRATAPARRPCRMSLRSSARSSSPWRHDWASPSTTTCRSSSGCSSTPSSSSTSLESGTTA